MLDHTNYEKNKFKSTILNKSVSVSLTLPNNYQSNNSYSTYLVFDANNLIENPNESILTSEINKIIIGVSCDDDIDRFNSWSTYHNEAAVSPMSRKFPSLIKEKVTYLGGNAINFNNFIVQELLPFIQKEKQIKIKDLNLLGCSIAAYFSLQMLYLSSTVFTKIILFSPSVWFNDSIIGDLKLKLLNNNHPLTVNLWVGLKEPKMFEKSFNVDYYQDALKVKEVLETKNNIKINFIVDENGGHGFKWWVSYINQHKELW